MIVFIIYRIFSKIIDQKKISEDSVDGCGRDIPVPIF
jgi:hypothetical protein